MNSEVSTTKQIKNLIRCEHKKTRINTYDQVRMALINPAI